MMRLCISTLVCLLMPSASKAAPTIAPAAAIPESERADVEAEADASLTPVENGPDLDNSGICPPGTKADLRTPRMQAAAAAAQTAPIEREKPMAPSPLRFGGTENLAL
mmetsp:Transcript_12204/g.21653  ORF Transcript_12204/g.21653 Transcript_12204/m.21653 type:complete len:108 (-) Transcript_12204:30-353(-)